MNNNATAIENLARWAHSQILAPMPAAVMHQAQRCILDVTACAAAGRDHPSVEAVTQTCNAVFAKGTSTVWYGDEQMSPVGAAMINANSATVLDLDDGNRQAMGHPGGAIVPAALAFGEELGATRDLILRAIIVGYEIAVRVGAAEQRPSYHSANYTGFGVTATIAVLRGLKPEAIAHALGIVAYFGPRVSDLTLSREMGNNVKESMPWSVVAGMMSAELAAAGFTGIRDALDIEERIDSTKLLRGLGDSHAISRTYFKRYSCCRWIHSAIEALLFILRENELCADMIDSVEIETFSQAYQLNNRTDPDTLESAQYSVPFCAALAAIQGEQKLMPLRWECLGDGNVTAFAQKVTVTVSDRMNAVFPDQVPARVSVFAGDRVLTHEIGAPWGEASRPPTDLELRDKFKLVAADKLSERRIDRIARAALSSGGSLDPLMKELKKSLCP